jgi:hypothetical protein
VNVDALALEIARAVQKSCSTSYTNKTQQRAAIQVAVAEVLNEPDPKNLVRLCPNCGSGDVEFCAISVRPYCVECNHWGPVNFGTVDDAVSDWNAALSKRR